MSYLYDFNTKQIIDKSREGKDPAKETKRLRRKENRLGHLHHTARCGNVLLANRISATNSTSAPSV
jgi:hypothetical protein